MKNFFKSKTVLSLLLILSFIGFYIFEVSLILKIAMFFLIVISFFMINIKKSDFALMLLAFLAYYNIYNFLFIRPFGYNFPIGLGMVLAVLLAVYLFYFGLIIKESTHENEELWSYYASIIGLIILEVFLVLVPWQIDPKNKAMILLVAFYLSWGLVCSRIENVLSLKKVFIYMILSVMVLSVTFITINQWQILKG